VNKISTTAVTVVLDSRYHSRLTRALVKWLGHVTLCHQYRNRDQHPDHTLTLRPPLARPRYHCIVWCETYLYILNRLGVAHQCDRRTDGQNGFTNSTVHRRALPLFRISSHFRFTYLHVHRVSEKTPTHIIGYKFRSSCLILIIFDTNIPHII